MSGRIINAMAIIAALSLLSARTALAAPMQCSGEEKTCLAVCVKYTNRAQVDACVAGCRASLVYCQHTGCWDNGGSRYCGLMRK